MTWLFVSEKVNRAIVGWKCGWKCFQYFCQNNALWRDWTSILLYSIIQAYSYSLIESVPLIHNREWVILSGLFLQLQTGDILFLQYRMAQIPAYLRGQGRGRGRGNNSSEKHSHSCPPGRIILSKKPRQISLFTLYKHQLWKDMDFYGSLHFFMRNSVPKNAVDQFFFL